MACHALAHYSAVCVRGEGAGAFLDAQLTQRVGDLEPGALRLAAWCNAQGRVRALFSVLRGGDAFWLILPGDLCAATLKLLQGYVLRTPVRLAALPAELGVFGGRGALPGFLCASVRGHQPWDQDRWLCIAEATPGEALAPAADWEADQIGLGIPEIYAASSAHWLPQSLKLEALGGLSYQKGCYPGQEIIARVHYRGSVKHVLARYTADAPTLATLEPGSPCTADAAIGTEVGEVLRVACPEGAAPAVLVVAENALAGSACLWSQGVRLRPVT